MYYMFGVVRRERGESVSEKVAGGHGLLGVVGLLLLGLVGLILGGKWIVDGAVEIAEVLGMGEKFVGLTIVALGTSLPELATSAVAAFKKKGAMALGNIVGSNIFNVFFILGLSAMVRPLPFDGVDGNVDIGVAVAASVAMFVAMISGGKSLRLERWQGICFVVLYLGYIVYLIVAGLNVHNSVNKKI